MEEFSLKLTRRETLLVIAVMLVAFGVGFWRIEEHNKVMEDFKVKRAARIPADQAAAREFLGIWMVRSVSKRGLILQRGVHRILIGPREYNNMTHGEIGDTVLADGDRVCLERKKDQEFRGEFYLPGDNGWTYWVSLTPMYSP